MFISTNEGSFARRGLAVLRGVGAWVAIHPEQTYVATRIAGLGTCKSTYVEPKRRELPADANGPRRPLVSLVAAAIAALGLLSGCATYQAVVDLRDVTDHGQSERGLADCQNAAGPVSPGARAGRASAPAATMLDAAGDGTRIAPASTCLGSVETASLDGDFKAGNAVQNFQTGTSGRGGFELG
ncbi:MAG: hypothetical protein ACREPX_12040 [Rhodanobacteraceae bacterium]